MERRTIALPTGPTSYLEADGGRRATVVLFHGGGLDNAHLSFGDLLPRLADAGYRALAPDFPGSGESPLPAGWRCTQEAVVAFAEQFIDAHDIAKPVVGGISMGGGTTLGYALANPDRVRAIIPLAPYGVFDRQYQGPLAGAAHGLTYVALRTGMLDAVTRHMLRTPADTRGAMAGAMAHPERLDDDLLDRVWREYENGGWKTFGQWQRDQYGPRSVRTNYWAQLPGITVPTCFIVGNLDRGVPAKNVRSAAAVCVRGEVHVVDDAGHWVQRDAPDEVARIVVDFLGRIAD